MLAVHTIYFWDELPAGLREIHRVLVPGGRVVLAFAPSSMACPAGSTPAVYWVPTTG